MESTVYQFDVAAKYYFYAYRGEWKATSSDNYFAIIPLEIGKVYKVTCQNITDLTKFQCMQSDSGTVGVADTSVMVDEGAPMNGAYLGFVATKNYLICTGGTTYGGELSVTCYSVSPVIGTKWKMRPEAMWLWYGYRFFKIDGTFYEGDAVLTELSSANNIFISTNKFGYGSELGSANQNLNNVPIVDSYYANKHWRLFRYYGGAGGGWVMRDLTDTLYLEITGGEDAENPALFAWLIGAGELVEEEPTATVITYNNETIATLEAGQTATIKTAETEVDYDIVVKAGSGGGGSAEFNIAYGDTAPSDTSKLWVKANEPEAVSVTSSIVFAGEELEAGVATLPEAAFNIAAAAVGTKVYLFGGENSSNLSAIRVYDKESNTITTLSTTLPKALSLLSAAAVGTKVYLFGGGDYAIYVFDTESNTITTLSTTLPTKAYLIASAVVGTKVYLFGGGAQGTTLNTINVFDTESNTITTLSTALPTKLNSIASAAVGTKVYLFGGNNGSGDCYSTIYAFDTKSNNITKLSTTLPTAAFRIASAVISTKVYLFGGYTGGSYLSTTNVFTVLMPLASNNMLIEASLNKNVFNLLSNVVLGVNNVYLGNADGNGERVDAYLHNGTEWVSV